VRIDDLLGILPGATLHHGRADVVVENVCYDSRKVAALCAFVALKGQSTDGHLFIDEARRRGAAVVISEELPRMDVPWIQVANARRALALLSSALFGRPADALSMLGITGTNGKTTTAYLVEAALRAAGQPTGLVGTVEYRYAGHVQEASRTTPESSDLQALFREMVDAGCRSVVMEVSSHSLALDRVYGCAFDVGVFTNLTRDHLDFHGDMETYFLAKQRLFAEYLKPNGVAIVNVDDERGAAIAEGCQAKVWTLSLERVADLCAREIELSLEGTRFRALTPMGEWSIESPLIGRFNVQNLLSALGAALAVGIAPAPAVAGLQSLRGVPGRLERIDGGQNFKVFVDYAHTDDALRKLLEAVRQLKPRRVLTLFGCGGDRDATKRPLMGAVAARLSDVVIVTSDNPRSEPPEAIIEAIERGMNGARTPAHLRIVDRREAIARVLEMAEAGDVVVIAGKGHERYQQLRDRTVPFDDREVVRQILGGRRDEETSKA
jgi:UDP-N-acetylmuramoyl-L-alanyl-D-glutamate--2,6-diaminopimelate ligase